MDTLGKYADFEPVCPEVGVGMGWGETDFRSLNDEFREYGVVGRFAGGFDVHIVDGLGLVVSGAKTPQD